MKTLLVITDLVLTVTLSVVCAWAAWVLFGDRSPLPTLCGLAVGAAAATAVRTFIENYLGD